MKKFKLFGLLLLMLFLREGCLHLIKIGQTQPHNRNCYSQGLFFINETHIFETCGLYNQSYFHILEYSAQPFDITEVYSSSIPWKINIFMEGAIIFNGHLYILTWREHVVYKLSLQNYQVLQQIKWNKDGWGLTHNGTHMFTTDGSDSIFLVDQNFRLVEQKSIKSQTGRKVYYINQLQYVDGLIYANIYMDSKIVKIDYERGQVVEVFDASSLISQEKKRNPLRTDEVINGIAYDKVNGKFLMTGKNWGNIYQIEL